jgi:hypothetical protein
VEIPAPAADFRLTPDERTAVFNSFSGLYMTTRADLASAFSTPALLPFGASYPNGISSPSITADALTLFFLAETSTGGGLFVVTRESTEAPFGGDTLLGVPLQGFAMSSAFVTSDGLTLYLSSFYPTTLAAVFPGPVLEARHADVTSDFDPLTYVFEAGSMPYGDVAPVVTDDGLTMFVSVGASDASTDAPHVQVATRTAANASFGLPIPLPGIRPTNCVPDVRPRVAYVSSTCGGRRGTSGRSG